MLLSTKIISKRLQNAREQLVSVSDLVKDLELKNKNLEEQLTNLVTEDDERGREAINRAGIEHKIAEARRANNELNTKLDESEATISRLQSEIRSLDATLQTKTKGLAIVTSDKTKLEEKLKNLQDNFTQLREAKEKNEQRFKTKKQQYKADNSDLFNETQKLSNELLAEKLKVEHGGKIISQLKDELNVANLEIHQASEKFIALQNKLAQLSGSDSTAPESLDLEIRTAI